TPLRVGRLGRTDAPRVLGNGNIRGRGGPDHRPRQYRPRGGDRAHRPVVRGRLCRRVLPYLLELAGLCFRVSVPSRGTQHHDSPCQGPPGEADRMKQPARVGLSLALLLSALLVLQLRSSGEAVPIRKSLDSFPNGIGQWQAREGVLLDLDTLNALRAKDYLMRRDQDPRGWSVFLFIAYWDSQRKGAQPHSPKNCLPGSGWEPLEASMVTIPLPRPWAPITVNRYLIQKDRDQQIVFYWYQSQGKAIAGEMAARMQMLRDSMGRHRTEGALVRISSAVYGSVQDTSDRLEKYIQAMYPVLSEYLPD